MSDDCKPFRIAQNVMIWMNKNGYIGEIECIYPIVVEEQMCIFKEKVRQISGFPVFQVLRCDNKAYIQNQNSSFIIWLSKDKEIDAEIIFKQLRFLISNNELVGIVCNEYTLIE